MSDAVLEIDAVTAGYLARVPVLQEVSMFVNPAELVAIVGPNGAGKSTVLKAVMGLIPTQSGEIRMFGRKLSGTKVHQIVREGISYVPQGVIVFPEMTVEENLDISQFGVSSQGFDKSARRAAVYEVFPRLAERRKQKAGSMSGGERQMVALGRCLMTEPKIILLDEPSLGLSPNFLEVVLDAIERLRAMGIGILMVEQNAAMALEIADRGYVLDLGKVGFTGKGKELLESPEVRRLYIGGGGVRPRVPGA